MKRLLSVLPEISRLSAVPLPSRGERFLGSAHEQPRRCSGGRCDEWFYSDLRDRPSQARRRV